MSAPAPPKSGYRLFPPDRNRRASPRRRPLSPSDAARRRPPAPSRPSRAAGRRSPLLRLAPSSEGKFGYRSEEHTSELQSLMLISYSVFFLIKKSSFFFFFFFFFFLFFF